MNDAKTIAALFRKKTELRPTLAMVLGSGFQHALTHFQVAQEFSCEELPGFPTPRVPGHCGKLLLGHFGKTPALILKGRAHYYEGHSMDQVTFPIRVLAEFGIGTILLTNAAGGINRKFRPGDFMAIEDHINFMGVSPLRGPALPGLPRFVDLSQVYDKQLTDLVKKAAKKSKLRLHSGTYIAVCGPNFETPAEVNAFRRWGADAVGMSTVPEAIVARQYGIRVAGLSCITNKAAGGGPEGLLHDDVLKTGERKKGQVAEFLQLFAEPGALFL